MVMAAASTDISKFTARFRDPARERRYHDYALSFYSQKDRYMLYAAVAVYILYGFLDLLTLTNATFLILTMRIFCAIGAFLIIRFSMTELGKRYFQELAGTLMLVAGLSIALMIWVEGTIDTPPYYVGLIVVAMVSTGLIRLTVPRTLFILLTVFTAFCLATWQMPIDVGRIAATFFIFSSFLLAGVSNYLLEMSRRHEFIKHEERLKLHQQLEQMVEDANSSLKRKNAILNILTHVFRTPLHQIIGYAQILEQESLGKQQHPEYVEYSEHIHKAGQNLLRLVQRLMKHGRLEAGTIRFNPQKVSVNELVECASSGISKKATDKLVHISFERAPISLEADASLVEDALYEILENAVQATPEGGTVRVTADKTDQHVIFLIEDEGPGIDNEQLEQIRNSMEMTEEFLSVSEKLSLGVTLTEKIIALHKGELDIRRAPESGTIVEIKLPVITPENSDGSERIEDKNYLLAS
ncbi:MAG: ATP-binding protein [Aquisalinus sp.]|nr:ATP-binding protein [Aquisalinus sp.]